MDKLNNIDYIEGAIKIERKLRKGRERFLSILGY